MMKAICVIVALGLAASFAAVAIAGPAVAGGAVVKRENGKVWIEGVPELKWGVSGECTFVGALHSALEVTDNRRSYAELMGVSGLAFRTRWFQDGPKWCPSSPVGEFPEEMNAIQKAIGVKFGGECLLDQKQPDMSKFAAQIAQSIEAGVPVVAYEPGLNMATIYGYENRGKTVLMFDYVKGAHSLPTNELGPFVVLLEKGGTASTPSDALKAALQTAVRNWDRDRDGKYRHGRTALAEWAKDIRGADALTKEQKDSLFFVSWWNFEALVDARAAAAEYLAASGKTLGGEAGASLTRAAKVYGTEAGMLSEASFAKKEAFFGPWSGKAIADWTPEARNREARLLDACRRLERVAISHLGTALEVMAGKPGVKEIPNVERLAWGGKDHTFIYATAHAMQVAGYKDVGYDWLMGATGAAFRVQISTDPFCPSAAVAPCGYDCFAEVNRVLGLGKLPSWTPKKDDPADRTKGFARIRKSLDKGVPVFFASEESGLVYGYQNGGKDLLATAYNGGEHVVDELPWGYSFLDGERKTLDRAKLTRDSLKLALKLAETPRFDGYFGGAEAYTRWISLLRNDDWLAVKDKDRLFAPMLGNAYCYDLLLQARQCAVRYLRLVVDDLGPSARPHLIQAAELYEKVCEALAMPRIQDLYPMSGIKWTHEMRAEQAARLEKAFGLEQRAWDEFRAALN